MNKVAPPPKKNTGTAAVRQDEGAANVRGVQIGMGKYLRGNIPGDCSFRTPLSAPYLGLAADSWVRLYGDTAVGRSVLAPLSLRHRPPVNVELQFTATTHLPPVQSRVVTDTTDHLFSRTSLTSRSRASLVI